MHVYTTGQWGLLFFFSCFIERSISFHLRSHFNLNIQCITIIYTVNNQLIIFRHTIFY